jgi:hypothetical protein
VKRDDTRTTQGWYNVTSAFQAKAKMKRANKNAKRAVTVNIKIYQPPTPAKVAVQVDLQMILGWSIV